MSTPATAKSAYLSSLIKNFAAKTTILKLGCEGLEEAIEYLNKKNIAKLLVKYTEKIRKFKADVIVLGCTHYPFLRKEIQKRVGRGVKIVDSGSAIAKRVKDILDKKDLLAQKKSPDRFFTTGDEKIFSKVASTLLQYKVVGQKACLPAGRP
jgi:glutamate racemase